MKYNFEQNIATIIPTQQGHTAAIHHFPNHSHLFGPNFVSIIKCRMYKIKSIYFCQIFCYEQTLIIKYFYNSNDKFGIFAKVVLFKIIFTKTNQLVWQCTLHMHMCVKFKHYISYLFYIPGLWELPQVVINCQKDNRWIKMVQQVILYCQNIPKYPKETKGLVLSQHCISLMKKLIFLQVAWGFLCY